ncbi:MAG: cellulose biosynthesis cyclic di-GMP-binding regulatory protein BcsB, partial [Chloroflexi bacterium]|nr:cellulose biosynthesis cyclic di-GMP-binding regulatory protein BcsB [Chloroflexota bacterium]
MRRYLDPLQVAMAVCVVLLVAWGHPLPVMSMPALSAEDFSPMAEETLAARPKPSSTLAFANEEEGVMEEHRLPLGKLTNEKPLILKGLNPSASLYLTLDEEERIVQGQLEIVFSHSETLLPHSSLTAKVNGVPIGSVQLGPENRDRAQWLLSVPAAALEGNGVELSFSGFLWTNDDPCLIIDDESSWVTIWPESALTAQSWLAYFQPNLGRFPYPFLRVRAFEKPTTLLVLPDEADGKAWVVALRLAAHLSKVAAWRELNLLPMREGELTPELARSYDIIFVGLADQLDALHEYAAQGPLRWAGEGRFLSPDGLSIEEDMGILIEMTSPWNPTRGILYVTGLGQVALERAAQALLQASFTSQARGVYALIRGVPEGPRQEMASWGNITFKELGYHDFVLQGVGTQTRDLVLDLPGRLR